MARVSKDLEADRISRAVEFMSTGAKLTKTSLSEMLQISKPAAGKMLAKLERIGYKLGRSEKREGRRGPVSEEFWVIAPPAKSSKKA